MKLGINTALFKKFDFSEAAELITNAGYDGLEICAIADMCEHLDVSKWKSQKKDILEALEKNSLELLSCEVASLDRSRLLCAFEAAAEMGIPIINVGSGGKTDAPGDFEHSVETLGGLSFLAAQYGVTLCFKPHVDAAIYNTATAKEAMRKAQSPNLGIDFDTSHIGYANENPEDAIAQMLTWVRHVHLRDYRRSDPFPGDAVGQTCGRGEMNIFGFLEKLEEASYGGPVCLEIIGDVASRDKAVAIAAESRGYLRACLQRMQAIKGR